MTLPAWNTFLASWHANAPVPLTEHQPSHQYYPQMNTGYNLRPAGMNTVLPSSEPLYFLNTCSAVTPASGRDAASLKERFFGLRATKRSGHFAYSLQAPTDRVSFEILSPYVSSLPQPGAKGHCITSAGFRQPRVDFIADAQAFHAFANSGNHTCSVVSNLVRKSGINGISSELCAR